ncbi:potassium channel family protein [Cellulomonas sp. P22]|uniref:potassium channel family protein n=1 Tax=Cellulomonas sp. P22 TaxID=3373189 RepID=UPI0037BDCBEF
MVSERRAVRRGAVLRSLATLTAAVVIYYAVPLDLEEDALPRLTRSVVFALGVLALIVLVVRQVRRQVQARADPAVRLLSVLTVVYTVVVFFALTYYLLATRSANEMVGIATRTDALYYTVVTLGTVGFGDVHAVGQVARIVTTVQILFDLFALGLLVSVVTYRIQTFGGRGVLPSDGEPPSD